MMCVFSVEADATWAFPKSWGAFAVKSSSCSSGWRPDGAMWGFPKMGVTGYPQKWLVYVGNPWEILWTWMIYDDLGLPGYQHSRKPPCCDCSGGNFHQPTRQPRILKHCTACPRHFLCRLQRGGQSLAIHCETILPFHRVSNSWLIEERALCKTSQGLLKHHETYWLMTWMWDSCWSFEAIPEGTIRHAARR